MQLALEDGTRTDLRVMSKDPAGYQTIEVVGAGHGTRYRFVPDGNGPVPDPCSRFQPEGPHGPSMVVNPARYPWRNPAPNVPLRGQVFYELHIGTFTEEGTFDSAIDLLPGLKELGITVIELMPVVEVAGKRNWGYDGVGLFAPTRNYGDEEAMKRFIDAAHGLGLGVILDVVYNHLGPDGNYLAQFSRSYFSRDHATDWGEGINFDGPGSEGVREFFMANAAYWISEFRLDGLRLDATQDIHDSSRPHILAEIGRVARAAAGDRRIVLVAENEPQRIEMVHPVEQGGLGLDGLWNDDFHHTVHAALTGSREAYYNDYTGSPQELLSSVLRGFLYQGQWYGWQEKGRGTLITGEPAEHLIVYLENHDQVANSLWGDRLVEMCAPGAYRAISALFLLGPQTPLLFMGQEYGATSPFLFFADHRESLRGPIHQGRRGFLRQFPSHAGPAAQAVVADPCAIETWRQCVLSREERRRNSPQLAFHRDLLSLRREDPVIRKQDRNRMAGAVLGPAALALRYFDPEHGDRLLLVNYGVGLELRPAREPLLSPGELRHWRLLWSSNDVRYRGPGIVHPEGPRGWNLPGQCAALLALSGEREEERQQDLPAAPSGAPPRREG